MAATKDKRFLVPRHWTLAERFRHYTSSPNENGCMLWSGSIGRSTGYGKIWWKGRDHSTHRIAWEFANGPIPNGMWICHKCDVRACVNPDHLFLGTSADNSADMMAKGRHSTNPRRGERTRSAKLTAEQVLAIRSDTRSITVIGAAYGIAHQNVSMIKRRKAWRHI